MQLKRLKITNFVGVEDAEISFEKPVSLFVGKNNQGKSTIKDAILFALTGRCRAMKFTKEVGNVIHGENGMVIELDYLEDDGEVKNIKRTKSSININTDGRDVLRYCLNPGEFISLPAKGRGKLLSDVLGGGMDELVKAAIAEYIGDIDETILAEIKGSGVNILDLDALREQVVQQRRSYKRSIELLPDKVPMPGDYELPQDYDVSKDELSVKTLLERINKGAQMIADVRQMTQTKADILQLESDIKKIESQGQEVPNLPQGTSEEKLNITTLYMTILEEMLDSDSIQLDCPICSLRPPRQAVQRRYDELLNWLTKHRKRIAERELANEKNAHLDLEHQNKTRLLEETKSRLKKVDLPKGGEDLLKKLVQERDAVLGKIANYRRFKSDESIFTDAGKQRESLKNLIIECNRIDEALKDGGPVKSAMATGGRRLPINESLLKLWDMEQLAWLDNGEMSLRGIPIEYVSDSEKYRASCVMALALAEVPGIGIAALDGFDVLVPGNANAFMQTVMACHINNVLVFYSTENDYSENYVPGWLEIFVIEQGKVRKLT